MPRYILLNSASTNAVVRNKVTHAQVRFNLAHFILIKPPSYQLLLSLTSLADIAPFLVRVVWAVPLAYEKTNSSE